MRKKCCFCLIALSLVSNVIGVEAMSQLNGIELLLTYRFIESVTVTSTNVVIRTNSSEDFKEIVRLWGLEPNAEIILTPDKETGFGIIDSEITLSPASFQNKRQGFQVRSSSHNTYRVAYIALSDTPVEVGEDDVEMVMDNGEWLTAEEARRLLEVMKLGSREVKLFKMAEAIKRDPKLMEEVLGNSWLAASWNELIEKGFITTNAVGQEVRATPLSHMKRWFGKRDGVAREDGQGNGQSNNPWLYIVIPLCVLCAILFFIWRKLKT